MREDIHTMGSVNVYIEGRDMIIEEDENMVILDSEEELET